MHYAPAKQLVMQALCVHADVRRVFLLIPTTSDDSCTMSSLFLPKDLEPVVRQTQCDVQPQLAQRDIQSARPSVDKTSQKTLIDEHMLMHASLHTKMGTCDLCAQSQPLSVAFSQAISLEEQAYMSHVASYGIDHVIDLLTAAVIRETLNNVDTVWAVMHDKCKLEPTLVTNPLALARLCAWWLSDQIRAVMPKMRADGVILCDRKDKLRLCNNCLLTVGSA